jgi:hypothetical protein
MSDVAKKIISSRAINNGRATIYAPGIAAQAQWGGWSGVMLQAPFSETALEARYTTRFDESRDSDVVNTFDTVSNIVNTTAAPLTGFDEGSQGIQLKASASNTGTIYVGPIGVTANTAQPTDGFPLAASEGIYYPINQTGVIYAISNVANQQLFITTI